MPTMRTEKRSSSQPAHSPPTAANPAVDPRTSDDRRGVKPAASTTESAWVSNPPYVA